MAEPSTGLANFATVSTGWMRRRGLKGDWVFVHHFRGHLVLAGQEGGRIDLPFSEIAKIRPGMFETKQKTYWSTWVWPKDGGRFELAGDHDMADYAAFVRSITGDLLTNHPGVRVESGSGYFLALYLAIAFGLMTAILLAVTFNMWRTGDRDWHMMIIPLSVPMILLLVFLLASVRRYLPRRVETPPDVDRGLPF